MHTNPTVSIIVPAYNEEVDIIHCLESMRYQSYGNCNIIVVNDGSTDNTLNVIINHFKMKERMVHTQRNNRNYKPVIKTYYGKGIVLIDKPNGGKSDALNCGFAYSKADYILSVDGDTLLDRTCLEVILRHKRPDADAVATMVGISNDNELKNGQILEPKIPTGFWAKVQWLEYNRGYALLRDSTIDKNCVTVISGACSLISAKMIEKTGGYVHDHLGEDMEHTLNIHRQGGTVQFLNKIVSWTEVPDNVRDLGKQRVRWFRGGYESYTEYKDLLFNKRNKVFGFFLLPYIWFSSIFVPWLIFFGVIFSLVGIFIFKTDYNLPLWFTMVGLYYTNTLIAFFYMKYRLKLYGRYRGLFWIMLIEGFTFHFLFTYWVIKAHLLEFFGSARNWNKIERKGFK